MSKKRLNKTKLWLVILLTLLNFAVDEGLGNNTASKFQSVPPDQIPAILTMISNETQSNYNKIKTWQGKVDATLENIYKGTEAERVFKNKTDGIGQIPEKIKQIKESSVEFSVNYEKGLFFEKKFYRNPLRYTEQNSTRVLGSKSIAGNTTKIATPEYLITCNPSKRRNNMVVTYQANKKKRTSKEDCPTCGKDVFDPVRDIVEGDSFRDAFSVLLYQLEKHGEFSIDGHFLRVEKRVEGAITEYRIEIPAKLSPEIFISTVMIFSSDKGFNLVSNKTQVIGGKVYQEMICDYETINGVYLPIRTMMQNYKGENAELAYQREYSITNLQVNQEIPEDTFADKNCGLREGEKLIDHTNNKKVFKLEKGKFVEFKGKKAGKKNADLTGSADIDSITNPSLYMTSSTPALPATLKTGERLVLDVFCEMPKEVKDARIFAFPYMNGKQTPGFELHPPSPVNRDDTPSGIVQCWFYSKSPATVDEVRLFMFDASGNIIHTGASPIEVEWVKEK